MHFSGEMRGEIWFISNEESSHIAGTFAPWFSLTKTEKPEAITVVVGLR